MKKLVILASAGLTLGGIATAEPFKTVLSSNRKAIAKLPLWRRKAIDRLRPRERFRSRAGAAIDRMLDSNTVPPPAKEFSANVAKAIQQMDQRAKRIDRGVMRGICTGC